MRAALVVAIDRLYEAFAHYPRPTDIKGCACCWGDDRARIVERDGREIAYVPAPGGRRPLEAVTAEELAPLAGSETIPDELLGPLKHYLPRILEIVATTGFPDEWPSPEVVLGRLHQDDLGVQPWTEWPDDERVAVERYLHELWLVRLGADDPDAVDETLCGLGCCDPGFSWYLDEWLRFEEPSAASHLESYVSDNFMAIAKGKLANSFWDRERPVVRANVDTFVAWFRSPATRSAVEEAIPRARTDEERSALHRLATQWLP